MNARRGSLALTITLVAAGCHEITQPAATVEGPGVSAQAQVAAVAAAGEFTQTSITTLEVSASGPNTIIDQTSQGVITGTIQGTFEDDLHVVIRQNGTFNTSFKITCQCEIGGKSGTLELSATDTGEMTSPTTASFGGRAVISKATGDLAGTSGMLEIEGTVDLASGLSTYAYSGNVR